MYEEKEIKIDDILNFLTEPKTRTEIRHRFNMDNRKSFRIMRWLEKGKYVKSFYARIDGQVGQKGKFYMKI